MIHKKIYKISLSDFINGDSYDDIYLELVDHLNSKYLVYENKLYNINTKELLNPNNGYFIYRHNKIKYSIAVEICKNGKITSNFVNKYYRKKTLEKKQIKYLQGISYNKRTNKYKSTIRVDNKKINLGTYEDIKDACRVRIFAELKYFNEIKTNLNPETKKILEIDYEQ